MTPPTSIVAGDKRFKILDVAIRKRQNKSDSLIAILHKAQELFGYLDDNVLRHVARALMLPQSRVRGVATFYHLFRLKPQGKHTCVVCLGTACFVNGGQKLLEKAEKTAGVPAGQTTKDGSVSLVVARCIGACGIAPTVVLDNQTVGRETPEELETRIQEWMHGS